ncbi:caspase family protein, partial [Alphaproteobacteria bacterium]|nr:caspase family protein [Alphaproteobacteria bacterium]
SFEWTGFVPATGKEITIEAIDTAALSSSKVIRLARGQIQQASGPRFDDLDPTAGKRVKRNVNALALIVGISDYERTDAPAVYADKDAQYFHDYASLKLGIPDSNITTLVNEKAEQGDVLLAVKDWIRRSSKPGESDVYIFFAGHGLASQDGQQMFLLPYDGRPRLLKNTAILRDELFTDIAAANPRSVTVFLDTCYSGTTRGPEMLVASRPIAIRAKESAIPEGFTVMTAAAGDQTAKPLEEAKHGMFSYFLMKGMEGDADANNDNQITAGELHTYVQQNVIQQSSGSQTPELQGDADRVLVRFQ